MEKNNNQNLSDPPVSKGIFERFATYVTIKTGSTGAFLTAVTIILAWIVTGPIFHYSDTWQLVINTGTTIITFLMVFLIQKSQNKDSVSIQLKLNELIASSDKASNRLVDVENLSEDELRVLSKYFHTLAEKAQKESNIHSSHSIDEAEKLHARKFGKKKDIV